MGFVISSSALLSEMQQAFGRLAPTRAYEVRLSRQGNLYLARSARRQGSAPRYRAQHHGLATCVRSSARVAGDRLVAVTAVLLRVARVPVPLPSGNGESPAAANREAANDKADECADNVGAAAATWARCPITTSAAAASAATA